MTDESTKLQPADGHGLDSERDAISKAGRLHLVHWAVICLSILLTVGAWYFAKRQIDEKIETQFTREADQVIELVSERMQKYEDGLWGGVAAIQAKGGDVSHTDWKTFANSLRIDVKYPGINGIGVVHHVTPNQLQSYLETQRRDRPEFRLHPEHEESEYWPIAHIEPVSLNAKAIGLDMAFEGNRYAAAKKARDTGVAQVTGPIVLVQDQERTPGFLFYAPFYKGGTYEAVVDRRKQITGLVYAPFVMKNLMAGTLKKEKRRVGIRISDGSDLLYDEHVSTEPDYDPDPLFKKEYGISLYGRVWSFDIWSTASFRAAASNSQPLIILFGGVLIDSLLLTLFVMLSRSNRRAIDFADRATDELRARTAELEKSNLELERFAYVSSHDLQEPLRTVSSYVQLLGRRYKGKLDADADDFIRYASEGAARMQTLIRDLLSYSRVGKEIKPFEPTDCQAVLDQTLGDLQAAIQEADGNVVIDSLPTVMGDRTQLVQLFQNLIGNAIKFRGESPPRVHIAAKRNGRDWCFSVQDNGIGIDRQYGERIFQVFQRLQGLEDFAGTGVGLALCKKIVENHGGRIWVESALGQGATFFFTIPDDQKS